MALADAVSYAIAHYTMDEASGTRVDSIGSYDLTDTYSSTGSTTGVFGSAAQLNSIDQLIGAANTDLAVGDDPYMLRFWVKFNSISFNMGRWSGGSGNREYLFSFFTGSKLGVYVDGPGGIAGPLDATNAGDLTTGVWYLVHFWHDPTANQVGIAIHGAASSTANTASYSGGLYTSTSIFGFGVDCDIDDVVVTRGYILDATERDDDWNGGTGVPFADWDAGGGAVVRTRSLLCMGCGC